MDDKMICVGAVIRPHGIRGELCVDCYADSPSVLKSTSWLEVRGGKRQQVKVSTLRLQKKGKQILLCLEGLIDRSAAESLIGGTLWIDRETLPELAEGEAYVTDLIGREVICADGTPVGILHHIETPSGQMLWALRDKKFEFLFPACPEFLVSLGSPIVIAPPQGLLETCKTALKQG